MITNWKEGEDRFLIFHMEKGIYYYIIIYME